MPLTSQFIKNLQRFRLVTFDVTDTLLCLKDPSKQYAETAAEYGVTNLDTTRIKQCFRQQYKKMNKMHPNFGCHTPNMSWQDWWIQLVCDVFRCVDGNLPSEQLTCIAKKLLQVYRTSACWNHIEGGAELIQSVRQAGKYVGVISNFDPSLNLVLHEMGLSDKFDFILTSYEAGIQKPNAEIFQIPLEKMHVEAAQSLHIGNEYAADYLGARSCGWSSLLVHSKCKTVDAKGKPNPATENGGNTAHMYITLADMFTALKTENIKW